MLLTVESRTEQTSVGDPPPNWAQNDIGDVVSVAT